MSVDTPSLPFVSCLCPTYRRPHLLRNAIGCFLQQDYPAERRELVILEDAGQLASQRGEGWDVVAVPRRFRSLPEKYNALAALARGEILVVWEDDDIYLPWHISAHVETLAKNGFSKPSRVRSLYTGTLSEQGAGGLFHGSLAFTRDRLTAVGGWPLTQRGDFDQTFVAHLAEGGRGDPCETGSPSYVFRWGSTQQYHGQALMGGPADTTWYERCEFLGQEAVQGIVTPELDAETSAILRSVSR